MAKTVLMLSDRQIEGLITMKEAIGAMEVSFRELAEGGARLIPRSIVQFPKGGQPEANYYFWHETAAQPSLKRLALRIVSRTQVVKTVEGINREELPGDFIGLILLYDTEDCELKAVLHDSHLSQLRVAATSGLAARYLARADSKVMGLFGAGKQGRTHAMAMCEVRPLRLIKVYDPNRASAATFAREMSEKLGREVKVVDEPHQAVAGSDIVVATTNANEPVFRGEWLEPGTHVLTMRGSEPYMKRWETDETTARRADVRVFNNAQVLRGGDLAFFPLIERGVIKWSDLCEVTDLVMGRCPGRTGSQQITVHYNNLGLGIQWVAVSDTVYRRARERGIGTELPLELFLTHNS